MGITLGGQPVFNRKEWEAQCSKGSDKKALGAVAVAPAVVDRAVCGSVCCARFPSRSQLGIMVLVWEHKGYPGGRDKGY